MVVAEKTSTAPENFWAPAHIRGLINGDDLSQEPGYRLLTNGTGPLEEEWDTGAGSLSHRVIVRNSNHELQSVALKLYAGSCFLPENWQEKTGVTITTIGWSSERTPTGTLTTVQAEYPALRTFGRPFIPTAAHQLFDWYMTEADTLEFSDPTPFKPKTMHYAPLSVCRISLKLALDDADGTHRFEISGGNDVHDAVIAKHLTVIEAYDDQGRLYRDISKRHRDYVE